MKLQYAGRKPADDIAGPIHRAPAIFAEWIGQELFAGQHLVVEIAERDSVSADIQLAERPDRLQEKIWAEDIDLRVGYRTADRNGSSRYVIRRNLVTTGEGCRLSRPITVDQSEVR